MMANMHDSSQHGHTQGDAANPSGQTKEQKKTLLKKISWDTILVISCVIAVSGDPLFFYIPIINEEIKCLGVDKNVRTAALLLRSVTDIAFIWNIINQIKEVTGKVRHLRNRRLRAKHSKTNDGKEDSQFKAGIKICFDKELARRMPWLSITIDILAVLPIPQVLMAAFFKLRSYNYLGRRNIIVVFLLAQYLPRIYLMHHSAIKLRLKKAVWVRGAFYFFLYILSSHLLGAVWYFFSIQRETQCWHMACMKHSTNECNFYCDQDVSSRNMTFISSLHQFCLLDVPANATIPFDFGIFLDSLKNGNTGQITFAKKFFYSFWWGLRNLSNFGTNLETSTYLLDNFFTILVSMGGLLLFLYLIGNVQTFITMESEKTEERRKKLLSTKMDIEAWMAKHCLPKELREEIEKVVRMKSEKIKDVDIENLYNILPKANRLSLKRHLCMESLQKALFRLEAMENSETIKEKVLASIYEVLKPVSYPDNSFIFRMGEPLDRILFITAGIVWAYNTTSSSISEDGEARTGAISLKRGAYYGDELLSWAANNFCSLGNVPMVKENVKCHTKVEGFVLMAEDLAVIRNKRYWNDPENIRQLAVKTIQSAVRMHQLLMRFKKDHQQKVPPTAALMAPSPEAAVVLEVQGEDSTTARSQIP